MGMSRKRDGEVILKLDLEKAYDQVDWNFLKQTMRLCYA